MYRQSYCIREWVYYDASASWINSSAALSLYNLKHGKKFRKLPTTLVGSIGRVNSKPFFEKNKIGRETTAHGRSSWSHLALESRRSSTIREWGGWAACELWRGIYMKTRISRARERHTRGRNLIRFFRTLLDASRLNGQAGQLAKNGSAS